MLNKSMVQKECYVESPFWCLQFAKWIGLFVWMLRYNVT